MLDCESADLEAQLRRELEESTILLSQVLCVRLILHVCGCSVVGRGLKRALETIQGGTKKDGKACLVLHVDCEELMARDPWCVVVVARLQRGVREKEATLQSQSGSSRWCRSQRSNCVTWKAVDPQSELEAQRESMPRRATMRALLTLTLFVSLALRDELTLSLPVRN